MRNAKKIISLFIDDFNTIAKEGAKSRTPNVIIERLQQAYLEFVILALFKTMKVSKKVKRGIYEKIGRKI